MPEIIRLLGRYDCFGHKGTDEEQKVLEFQYGARMCISNYDDVYDYLTRSWTSGDDLLMMYNQGAAIYNYLCTEAKQLYKRAFPIKLRKSFLQLGDKFKVDFDNI